MRTRLRMIALLLCMVMLLSACGSAVEQPVTGATTHPTTETTVPVAESYTVIFDKNTTPDDTTDDESFSYYTSGWGAQKKSSVVEIPKTDDAHITVDMVPTPTRRGYYFAGWHTKPVITEEDIVNGVSKYQVFFGTKVSELGAIESAAAGVMLENEAMYIKDFESLAEDGTLTLYARWVEAKEISTEQQLRDISKDLYGAYILTADIELTEEWIPIGMYFNNYTYYNDSWWVYAFRGTLNGNGHTVSGLEVNGARIESLVNPDDSNTVWHDDGISANGTAAMFGAICGANISGLTLETPRIYVAEDYAYSGDYCYAAPLACFDMLSTLTGIRVKNPEICVEYTDAQLQNNKALYLAVAGLEAGGWNSTVNGCVVEDAKITVSYQSHTTHGGQVFVGGMIGECFATMQNNTVQSDIRLNGQDVSAVAEDSSLIVNVGGMSAANTSSSGNAVDTNMDISVSKPVGEAVINVGGYSGSQKYMSADNNTIKAQIKTEFALDEEKGQANVGAVLGRIDPYYITLILLYANEVNCGASGNVVNVMHNGETLTAAMPESGRVHLNGETLSYIATRDFTDESGNSYFENASAVIAAYGSYIPLEQMINDILYMNVD